MTPRQRTALALAEILWWATIALLGSLLAWGAVASGDPVELSFVATVCVLGALGCWAAR